MNAVLIALSTAIVLGGPQPRAAMSLSSNTLTIPRCLVTLVNDGDVHVPARESGQLVSVAVREGQQVTKEQLLAQIDDSMVRKGEEVARYKLQQAELEAKDDVNIRYAKASADVASADLAKSLETNKKVPNTVPETELRKQWLEKERSLLGIEKAGRDFEVAGLAVESKRAEHSATKLDVDRRQIKAPMDGFVEKRIAHVGDWLKQGDPVLQMQRLDRLRIEGFVDATGPNSVLPSEVDGRTVRVDIALARGQEAHLRGKIDHVSSGVEAGSQFLIKAEVINEQRDGHWVLRPGMTADMTVELGR
jgi:multidrug efflux pump subunit AcrA (membrane-fusion protein)